MGSNKAQDVAPPPVFEVAVPTIVTPATNPYYSAANSIVVEGLCMEGYKVKIVNLIGMPKGTKICQNYSYSIALGELYDGIYNYYITQSLADGSGQPSLPVPLIWVKKTSIATPVITNPPAPTYNSSIDQLTISGSCESNATVELAGDAAGTTTCQNSSFSIPITKIGNGNFTIIVKQSDYAGNTAQTQFNWSKIGLGVSPSAPTLQVGTTQVFTLLGGSGSYTAVLTSNPSGGTFDAATNLYTAGPIAGAVDVLTVVDTLGVSTTVPITTFHGPADHLEFATASGDGQDGFTGQMLALPFAARVVDQYGNGVAFYPTFFQIVEGSGVVSGSVLQTSDLNGDIKVSVRAGDTSTNNKILLTPFGTTLPDLAASGNIRLEFSFITKYLGTGLKGAKFALSSNPNSVATGDLDSDTFIDAVVLNSAEPSLGILKGLGNGLFDSMTKVKPVCANPNSVILADVNEDGLKDIVITCGSSTSAIQVFLNQGNLTFSPASNSPIDSDNESIPFMVKAVDLDGDGHLDILTSNAGSSNGISTVSIRKGNGAGTFALPTFVQVSDSPSDIAVGDFNKDGKKDFVTLSSALNLLVIATNQGSMSFDNSQSMNTGSTPLAVAVKDVNNDSWDDIVVLNAGSSSVTVYLNDKVGGFFEKTSLVTGAGATAMDVRDLDNDGILDIAVANGTDSTVNTFFGDGTGLFDSSVLPVTVVTNPSGLAIDDVNGDLVPDLLVIGNVTNQLEFIPGQAGRKFGFKTRVDSNPTDIVFGDFNRNGTKDMAVLSKGGRNITLYNGNGKGLFTVASGTPLATGDDSEFLIGVDLKKRNRTDFIVTSPTKGSIRIFTAAASGTYAAPVDVSVGLGPTALASCDFDRDSYPDVVVANSSNASVSVLMNDKTGVLATKRDFATGPNPSSVACADLNGDGNMDIIASSSGINSVSVLIGNGDGTFQNRVDYGAGNSLTNLVVGDFNNDQFQDVAVLATADNVVSIFLGNGDGSLRASNPYSAGTGLKGLVLSDFNGDGKMDLAVGNSDVFQFTVLHGAGNGQFNTTQLNESPSPVIGVKSADVNGDNIMDIIVIDSTNSDINVWLGH